MIRTKIVKKIKIQKENNNKNKNKNKNKQKNEEINQNIIDNNIPVLSDIQIITTSLGDSSTLVPDSKDYLANDPDNPYYVPHTCNPFKEEIQSGAIEPRPEQNQNDNYHYETKNEINLENMKLNNSKSKSKSKEIINSRKNYNKERDKSYDRNSSCQSCKECLVL